MNLQAAHARVIIRPDAENANGAEKLKLSVRAIGCIERLSIMVGKSYIRQRIDSALPFWVDALPFVRNCGIGTVNEIRGYLQLPKISSDRFKDILRIGFLYRRTHEPDVPTPQNPARN